MKKYIAMIDYCWGFYKCLKLRTLIYLIVKMGYIFLGIATPLIYAKLMSTLVSGKDIELVMLFLILGSVYFLNEILRYILRTMEINISKTVNYNVRKCCIYEMIYTNYSYNSNVAHGKLLNMFFSDTLTVNSYMTGIMALFFSGANMMLTVSIIVAVNWKMAIIICSSYPIEYFVSFIFNKKIRRQSLMLCEKTDDLYDYVKNVIGNLLDVKRQVGEKKTTNQIIEKSKKGKMVAISQSKTVALMKFIVSLVRLGAYLLFFGVGIHQVFEGEIELGMFLALGLYAKKLSSCMEGIIGIIAGFQSQIVSLERLREVRCRFKLSNEENNKAVQIKGEVEQIELKDVSLSFGEKEIFNKISIDFVKGRIYGITGENGVGKSCIINMLLRNIRPTQGGILFNNSDCSAISVKWIYEQIACADAEKTIYNMSIQDNICLSEDIEDIEVAKILDACKVVGLEDVINTSADLNYVIRNYTQLSAGQIQKLRMARMLLRDCPVFVLDEAFVNIDVNSKEKILQYLYNQKKEKIIIIVSHNADELKICTDIYQIENKFVKKVMECM